MIGERGRERPWMWLLVRRQEGDHRRWTPPPHHHQSYRSRPFRAVEILSRPVNQCHTRLLSLCHWAREDPHQEAQKTDSNLLHGSARLLASGLISAKVPPTIPAEIVDFVQCELLSSEYLYKSNRKSGSSFFFCESLALHSFTIHFQNDDLLLSSSDPKL